MEKRKTSSDSEPEVVSPFVTKIAGRGTGQLDTWCQRSVGTLALFGADEIVLESFHTQARKWLGGGNDLVFVSRAKKLCAFLRGSYLDGTEMADMEGFKFSGPFRRWSRSRMHFSRKNTALWSAFYLLKNVALPVSPTVIKSELQKHAAGISRTDTADEAFVGRVVDNIGPILDRIGARVASECGDLNWWLDETSKLPISTSASFTTTRLRGGCAGDVYAQITSGDVYEFVSSPETALQEAYRARPCANYPIDHKYEAILRPRKRRWDVSNPADVRLLAGLAHPNKRDDHDHDWTPILPPGWYWEPGVGQVYLKSKDEAQKWFWRVYEDAEDENWCSQEMHWWLVDRTWHAEDPEEDLYVDATYDECEVRIGYSHPVMRAKYRAWVACALEDVTSNYLGGRPELTRAVPIGEPLKVRVITIDRVQVSIVGRLWQKMFHSSMKLEPQFRLLGEAPNCPDVGELQKYHLGDEVWGSSDFSGASNGTPRCYRERVMDRLQAALPGFFRLAALANNASCLVRYADKYEIPETLQIQGTIMGRVTSFIILSAQVFGAHAYPARMMGVPLWYVSRGVLINGDDRLARTSRHYDSLFWNVCRELQFGKSLGKSYAHPTYANINSRSYHIVRGEAYRVSGLACGLLWGQKKLATDIFNPTEVFGELMDSCHTTTLAHRVARMFLTYHAPRLRKMLAGRDLYAHSSVGGLGQRMPGWSPKYGYWDTNFVLRKTMKARKFATAVMVAYPELRHRDEWRHDLRLAPQLIPKEPWDSADGLPKWWDLNRSVDDFNLPKFSLRDRVFEDARLEAAYLEVERGNHPVMCASKLRSLCLAPHVVRRSSGGVRIDRRLRELHANPTLQAFAERLVDLSRRGDGIIPPERPVVWSPDIGVADLDRTGGVSEDLGVPDIGDVPGQPVALQFRLTADECEIVADALERFPLDLPEVAWDTCGVCSSRCQWSDGACRVCLMERVPHGVRWATSPTVQS